MNYCSTPHMLGGANDTMMRDVKTANQPQKSALYLQLYPISSRNFRINSLPQAAPLRDRRKGVKGECRWSRAVERAKR
jgi:hypothetical protein